jgi:hypothetical protein
LSPPPLAVALLFALVVPTATATFNVNVVVAFGARIPLYTQASVGAPVQLQLLPLAVTRVMPVGNVSATVMLLMVGLPPVFVTLIV